MNKQTVIQKMPTRGTLAGPAVLQRACACGSHTMGGGECESCKKKDPGNTVQRRATNSEPLDEAPPIVDEVLHSSGQSLDASTRTFFESRFGHDFSDVRIHADAHAAESAQAVNAFAYTVGRDIVFGTSQYSPLTPSGQRLLAHELTHVVQQEKTTGPAPQKLNVGKPGDAAEVEAEKMSARVVEQGTFMPIAQTRVHTAPALRRHNILDEIAGWFEGDSYDDPTLQAYLKVLDETGKIEDFSNSDNKARAVVNHWAQGGTKFNLTPERKLLLVKEMLSGSTGDDDELAILEVFNRSSNDDLNSLFARLTVKELEHAFDGDELDQLHDFYEHRFEGGMEQMLKGAIKAVGEPTAPGAAKPEPSQYELKLKEAYQKLTGIDFGPTGGLMPENLCNPESIDTSAGSKIIYWYDKSFWEPDVDTFPNEKRRACKLKLLSGKSASAAIDALFNDQGKWKVDCAQFVQIFHLYALRHTLGDEKFDAKFKDDMRLELRRRQSSGVETKVLFSRKAANETMSRSTDGKTETKRINQLLAEAPIGTRVRWTNSDKRALGSDWENENSVKMGPDQYAAHPLFKIRFPWVTGKDYLLSRKEVELEMAKAFDSKAAEAYVQTFIFISEIEYFKDPTRPQ